MAFLAIPEGILASAMVARAITRAENFMMMSGSALEQITGDVQIEFLLNDTGNLKARIFNKENEYQFFGDEIGYTQGIGISYDVEFDSFSELIQKIRKKKKK